MLNDDNAYLTPWNQARSNGKNVYAAVGENATALSLGFRYDF